MFHVYAMHFKTSGLPPFINDSHEKKMEKNNRLRLVLVFLVFFFVWTSQSRIKRYCKSHNKSYFSHRRQNIATVDQTICYAYLKSFCNILRNCLFMSLFILKSTEVMAFLYLYTDIICVIVGMVQ